MNNLWQFYKTLFTSSKRWIWFACGAFFVFGIGGWAAYTEYPGLMEQIIEAFSRITGDSEEMSASLVFAIFRQNLQSCLIALFGGIVLGIVPFFIVWVNGFLLGYVAKYFVVTTAGSMGTKLLLLAAVLLPHGIFELPIVLISAALGMKLGTHWLKKQPEVTRGAIFKQDLINSFKFVPLLIVVLAMAAFIEVFVSGYFASLGQ